MKALSIQQPWAWAIIYGGKDVENRCWKTSHRGPVLIHASKKFDGEGLDWLFKNEKELGVELSYRMLTGGIVGIADIVDCITESSSKWFFGPYGFVLENVRELPFASYRGRLGLFDIDISEMDLFRLLPENIAETYC